MPHSVVAMEGEGHHHVVIVTVPCPGHIIPAAQVAKYLLALGIRVSCFSTGMNYPSVEHNLLENLHGQRIQFRPLIDASEFVSPGKEITDNIGWMQAPSDGEMTTRLNNILKTLTPPPQCIISDLLVGWTQDVADGLHIPHHVIYTMPANALLFSFGVHANSHPNSLQFVCSLSRACLSLGGDCCVAVHPIVVATPIFCNFCVPFEGVLFLSWVVMLLRCSASHRCCHPKWRPSIRQARGIPWWTRRMRFTIT